MSTILTEREIITNLLIQYKNSPCLWDPGHKSYFNKDARNRQYEQMLEVYRQLDPNGTVLSLKKKIEHYRAAYRRERKKVENSLVSGPSANYVHTPILWYYNLLTFLNVKHDNSSEEDDAKAVKVKNTKKKRKSSPVTKIKKCDNNEINEQQDENDTAKCDTPDYITAYAESIARQLKELDEPVRYEAERMISDVIYRARTGTLPKYSPQAVDTLMIPQLEPSWYDLAAQDEDQNATQCFVVSLTNEVIKTEHDYDAIKTEPDEDEKS